MAGLRTRGHPAAVAAVRGMIRGPVPHAVLIAGPAGVGKTTLALDLAAGLLCQAADPADRPCRTCRTCRMVDHGHHPDLHRLAPQGPGGQIVIGRGASGTARGVRDLIMDLALLPVEGGARVAVIEAAHRMNEDAQSALLKTLEEPPAGVVLILAADEEDRLLDTVRSRCRRIRLGPVPAAEVEIILADLGVADPPLAARLARLTGGRPGLAAAYARAPDGLRARHEAARILLDLTAEPVARRLAANRELLALAGGALAALEAATNPAAGDSGSGPTARPARRSSGAKTPASAPVASADAVGSGELGGSGNPGASGDQGEPGSVTDAPPGATRTPAAERRRATAWLLDVWRDLARDLAVVERGSPASVRDPGLLDDLAVVGPALPPGAATAFLVRLGDLAEGLDTNVSPELLTDVLVLAWPRRSRVA